MMRYLCYFYNFDYSREFDNRAAAEECGLESGFQYTIIEIPA
jgi:hypothetical protein